MFDWLYMYSEDFEVKLNKNLFKKRYKIYYQYLIYYAMIFINIIL